MTSLQKRLRFLWISVPIAVLLAAKQPSIEHYDTQNRRIFELLADSLSMDNDIIKGMGNVLVVSNGYYANSDRAHYNTTSREIFLEGNVSVFKDDNLYLKAQKVRLELDDNYAILEPLYLQETTTGIWITAQNAISDNEQYFLQDSTFSSCSIDAPVWGISFSSGNYNPESSWIELWNARVYLYKYPIFYTPYLAFSLNQQRKTGFLFPKLKTSTNDGFVYNQPFYYAINERQDATLTSMLRSRRGYGAELEYRYADEKNEILKVNLGYFDIKNSYRESHNLANSNYNGFFMQYKRYNLLSPWLPHFNGDGFYIDWANINDIDYLRLRENDNINVDIYDRLLTSRINYFLKSEDDYLGAYIKYYTDLSQVNNDSTLQTLPTIQYHRYFAPLFLDNINYAFEYRMDNYTRKSGYSLLQNTFLLPVTYTQSLLDDYLFFTLGTQLALLTTDYYRRDSISSAFERGFYYSNEYLIQLSSDLVRPYQNFLHTLSFDLTYSLQGFHGSYGDFALINIINSPHSIDLKASQYYHFTNGMQIIHRVSQPIFHDKNELVWGDLEHEINWIPNEDWIFSSSIFYSPSKQKIAEIAHDVSYTDNRMAVYLGHFRRKENTRFIEQSWDANAANFIHFGYTKKYEWFDIFGSIGYDYDRKYIRTWNTGIQKAIRCFSYRVRVASEIRPLLTSDGVRPQEDHYIVFEIGLLPLVSMPFKINTKGL